MKTEIYRWRVSSEKIAALQAEARKEGISLSRLLNRITGRWLKERRCRSLNEADQAVIRRRVMAVVGSIRGEDPMRSARASELVREIIGRKHEKESRQARKGK